ncbi:hypothetical protein Tco_1075011 [Tanacetum coccineum]
MERRDTPIPCLCGTFWVSLVAYSASANLSPNVKSEHREAKELHSSYSLLLTPMCCDDVYLVTPRVSALAGCDRLVSEPGYRELSKHFVFLLFFLSFISTYGLLDIIRFRRGANCGGASRGSKGGRVVEESEKEADSDLLLDARSRPGLADSSDSCERKVKPKRGPT